MEPSGKHQSTASVRHHLPGHSVYRPFVSVGVCQASSPGACSRFTLHDKVRPLHGAKEMITRILRYCVASHDRVCRLVGRPGRRTRRARPGQAGPPSRARRLALHGRGPGGAPPGCAHGWAGRYLWPGAIGGGWERAAGIQLNPCAPLSTGSKSSLLKPSYLPSRFDDIFRSTRMPANSCGEPSTPLTG